MFLYLVQHAEAMREEENPSRPLTMRGIAEADRVGSLVASAGIGLSRIHHSAKLRAAQTAQILESHLHPPSGVSEVEGLAPMDDPTFWAGRVQKIDENLMLVGHLPHLERLLSLLIVKDPGVRVVSFTMGGVVCLHGAQDGSWNIRWVITPEIVPA